MATVVDLMNEEMCHRAKHGHYGIGGGIRSVPIPRGVVSCASCGYVISANGRRAPQRSERDPNTGQMVVVDDGTEGVEYGPWLPTTTATMPYESRQYVCNPRCLTMHHLYYVNRGKDYPYNMVTGAVLNGTNYNASTQKGFRFTITEAKKVKADVKRENSEARKLARAAERSAAKMARDAQKVGA